MLGDDIRLACAPVSADAAFIALSVIALILFTTELLLNWFTEPESYQLKFYFWIDLIAIISLIPDITWVWDPFMSNFRSSQESVNDTGWSNSSKLVRVVRLVRIVRMGKLFKMTSHSHSQEGEDVGKPSQVGQTMSDITLRKVIMLVFLLIIPLPIFDGGLTQSLDTYQSKGLQRIHHMAQLAQDYNQTGYVSEEIFHRNFDVSQPF